MRFAPLLLLLIACLPDKARRDTDPAADLDNRDGRTTHTFSWTAPTADVLFVIDDSCSMSEEQQSLAGAFRVMSAFFDQVGFDWHVGVVSTDMDLNNADAGHLVTMGGAAYLHAATPDPDDLFAAMVQMGTGGSATEQGRNAAYTAIELERFGANAGFYRDDAQLAIIVLSDEEDQSGNIPISTDQFIHWLTQLKPTLGDVSFTSIVTPSSQCPTGFTEGTQYTRVTKAVGGVSWNICNDDYAVPLGMVVDRYLFTSDAWVLAREPDPATLIVTLINGEHTERLPRKDWTYGEGDNAVRLRNLWPRQGDQFEVSYVPIAGPEVP